MNNSGSRPVKQTRSHTKRRFWILVLVITGVPSVIAASAYLLVASRVYVLNRAVAENVRLPVMASPRSPQRLLIFSPHCDDETLGAAGLIRQGQQHGCDVRVVLITNGDGFHVSASRELHEVIVPPSDYIQFGYRRQSETRTALKLLGLAPDHVSFLGYPDRGLMPMWMDYWSPDAPFRSAFTLTDHCPYSNAVTPHAAYCGASLLQDIKQEIIRDKPTDIFVTHPNDDHPDHAAASIFVQTALEQVKAQRLLNAQSFSWAQTTQLHYYLVHHGDWPVPQGLHEQEPLAPPASLASGDTQWRQLPLTPKDTQTKYAAINRYPTQTRVSSRFLFSFARKNEMFGTWNGVTTDHLASVKDDSDHWLGLKPVLLDNADDTIARTFTPCADIVHVFACRDSKSLHLRLETRGPISPDVSYVFTVRRVVPGTVNFPAYTLTRPAGPTRSSRLLPGPHHREEHGDGNFISTEGIVRGESYSWHGNTLEVNETPLMGLDRPAPGTMLFIATETRVHDVTIDSTGFRGLLCQ